MLINKITSEILTILIITLLLILFSIIVQIIFKKNSKHKRKLFLKFGNSISNIGSFFSIFSDEGLKQTLLSKYFYIDVYYTIKGNYINRVSNKSLLKVEKNKIILILMIILIISTPIIYYIVENYLYSGYSETKNYDNIKITMPSGVKLEQISYNHWKDSKRGIEINIIGNNTHEINNKINTLKKLEKIRGNYFVEELPINCLSYKNKKGHNHIYVINKDYTKAIHVYAINKEEAIEIAKSIVSLNPDFKSDETI